MLTTSVNDIEHIESQSLFGVGVIRIYFYPGAKIEAAVAQVTATSQAILKVMPPGIDPPYIVQYSATSVPIVQIAVSSDTLTEQQILRLCRQLHHPAAGRRAGRTGAAALGRQVAAGHGRSRPRRSSTPAASPPRTSRPPSTTRTSSCPSGTAKIGDTEYYVKLNSSPQLIAAFNNMPVKTVNGVPIYVKDVANVHMGYAVQTNVVRRDGRRAVLMTILKGEGASSLDVVRRVREALPGIQAQVPPELKMELLFDQSVFVRAAVEGVLKEGAIAAGLTALMILLFLGSWRSTLIVAISIPLSILTSVIVLWALGQSLNIMTLGGMALAVGMLVDDATVELENIHRNFAPQQADPPGDPRQCAADRHAGVRLHAWHLHRVCAGPVPQRARGVAVLPAGAGRGLRHADLLLAVAHAGADHGALPAAARPSRGPAVDDRSGDGRRPAMVGSDLAASSRVRSPLRAPRDAYERPARLGSAITAWLTLAACWASPPARWR